MIYFRIAELLYEKQTRELRAMRVLRVMKFLKSITIFEGNQYLHQNILNRAKGNR
jgi:hypothetical protein